MNSKAVQPNCKEWSAIRDFFIRVLVFYMVGSRNQRAYPVVFSAGEDLIGHAEILPCDFAGDPAPRAQASWPGQTTLANAAKQQLYNMASWKYGKHGKSGKAAGRREKAAPAV